MKHPMYHAATRYAQQAIAEIAARQSVPGAYCIWPPVAGRVRERVFLTAGESRCARVVWVDDGTTPF